MPSYATFNLSFTDDVSGAPLLTHIKAINFLFQRGTDPSRGTIVCKQQTIVKTVGTVTITYNPASGSPISIVLPGSLIVAGSKTVANDGTMQLTFLDRRWRWDFGHIDGRYNAKKSDGSYIIEKTPAELMTLCLEAMGESGYDVSDVSGDPRPFVEWRGDVPAECLQELCDELGYIPVIRANNTVKIYEVNDGTLLPTAYASSIDFAVKQGALPEKVRVACGDILYQVKFKLEAVGEDIDGVVYPIDLLSYKPTTGWKTDDKDEWWDVTGTYTDTDSGADVPKRELARKCIYKWYRVKELSHSDENFAPPGFLPGPGDFAAEHITSLEQLLPLIGQLNEVTYQDDGTESRRPPKVTGIYFNDYDSTTNTDLSTPFRGGFSLDAENGIVKFGSSVYRTFDEGEQTYRMPADLRLLCSVAVTTPVGSKQYYGHDTVASVSGSGVKTIDHPEITPMVTPVYNGDASPSQVNNLSDVAAEAAYYAAAEIDRMTPQEGGSIRYGRIVTLELDGLRSQISWDAREGAVPFTEAAASSQINSYLPSYRDMQDQIAGRREARRSRRRRMARQPQVDHVFVPSRTGDVQFA